MQPTLETLPLFRSLTPEERSELESLLEPASFAEGEDLITEGGPEEHLYALTSGEVEVHKEVVPGRRQHLATMRAPTVVGEMGLMTTPKATATVTAKSDTAGWRLPRAAFLEKLDAGSVAAHKVAYEIGRTIAGRMADTDEAVARIVARLDDASSDRDFEVFGDKLMRDWSF
ncbi:cyclic nucleotide-binding domain-containing protein [Rubrobacter marinus]|uniref:cyclic nucleotide-binding domain-containing protein n=1 Tax=Rubrobacter marinus TaxID=2653852 RepID=UPI001409447D|nr:cyclic nucleotide-binding domain-containing protein [Rubrobacter marinus]